MLSALRSAWIWASVTALILFWLPLLGTIRLFDRDPVSYRTGKWFRRLGVAMTVVNPAWKLTLSGAMSPERKPYVVVSNHQSMADIPLISHVPWEMKWVGKVELFRLPLMGWMMRLAQDIPVDRSDRRSGARMMLRVLKTLENNCAVIFFPEGTRSPDGRIGKFNDGAFQLAIKARVPVLPLAIEGSGRCLPKKSWKFGPPATIRLHALEPVPTEGLTAEDAPALRDRVRGLIARQIAEWRGVDISAVDGSAGQQGLPADGSAR
jgi:1-acyl-sn-glycerol-3-phosphate acyltransferase